MVLEYSLTEDDFFHFNFYAGWASPEKKSYRIWYYIKYIGYAFIGALFLIIVDKRTQPNFLLLAGVAIVIGLAFGYFQIDITYKKQIRDLISAQKNPALYIKREMVVNDAGITEKDENSETKYSWVAITKKMETPEYIYLFLSSIHGIIIPKRILDQKQSEELRLLLSKNLTLGAEMDHLYKN